MIANILSYRNIIHVVSVVSSVMSCRQVSRKTRDKIFVLNRARLGTKIQVIAIPTQHTLHHLLLLTNSCSAASAHLLNLQEDEICHDACSLCHGCPSFCSPKVRRIVFVLQQVRLFVKIVRRMLSSETMMLY